MFRQLFTTILDSLHPYFAGCSFPDVSGNSPVTSITRRGEWGGGK